MPVGTEQHSLTIRTPQGKAIGPLMGQLSELTCGKVIDPDVRLFPVDLHGDPLTVRREPRQVVVLGRYRQRPHLSLAIHPDQKPLLPWGDVVHSEVLGQIVDDDFRICAENLGAPRDHTVDRLLPSLCASAPAQAPLQGMASNARSTHQFRPGSVGEGVGPGLLDQRQQRDHQR